MQDNPFETRRELRGRALVVRGILAFIASFITDLYSSLDPAEVLRFQTH